VIHNFDIIAFDTSELNPDDLLQALLDNGVESLEESVAEKLKECLRNDHQKIFLDGKTHKVIGYIDNETGVVVFTKEFTENLKWMPSIKPKPKIILEIDVILEKIKSKGMDSLYPEEREYLKKQSGKG